MTKKILLTILSFIILSGSVIYLQSCDIKSPTDGVSVLFNTDAPETAGTISFIDATTSQLITANNVSVSILGSNAGKITNFSGGIQASFTSGGGIISFGVDASATLPMEITVLASASGYLTTSIPVTITSKGCATYNFYMVNIANPPDGVSIRQYIDAGTVSGGALTTTENLETPLGNGTGGVCKIRLPAGTIITDNSPSPINLNGQLKATLAYFDPRKETALRCFPGGFRIGDNTMVSAGFALFEITDASGRNAKKFPGIQPEITIEIPTGTNNFSQNRTIQLGDVIPTFSYENLAGVWAAEAQGTVVAGGNSNFAIKFNTAHLSFWNLDFLTGANCAMSRKIFFNQTGGCSQAALDVKLYFVSNGVETYYKTVTKAALDSSIQFQYAPSANMRIKLYFNNSLIQTYNDVNLCATENLTLTYTVPNLQSITGTVVGICTNNANVQVHPTLPIYYKATGSTNWTYLGYMVNGNITKYCASFGTYDFLTYYNNQAIYANGISIQQSVVSFQFSLGVCQ